ncbi:MAG: Uma2 family endonuclease [Phormidesmis sp.]
MPTIKVAFEVVSTNWPDDYARKYENYEAMGIEEYWIVDYLGLCGRRFIGSPKQPTITVSRLVEGRYESTLFRAGETATSTIFPGLVSVDQVVRFA